MSTHISEPHPSPGGTLDAIQVTEGPSGVEILQVFAWDDGSGEYAPVNGQGIIVEHADLRWLIRTLQLAELNSHPHVFVYIEQGPSGIHMHVPALGIHERGEERGALDQMLLDKVHEVWDGRPDPEPVEDLGPWERKFQEGRCSRERVTWYTRDELAELAVERDGR